MQNELTPPMQYNGLWLLIGIVFLLSVCVLNIGIVWVTRKKKIRKITTLPKLQPVLQLDTLKQKYLSLITEIEMQFEKQQITTRQVHNLLSTTIRLFVFEAKGIAAHKQTLEEIRRAGLDSLVVVVEKLYPAEFMEQPASDARAAIAEARRMVQQWS